MGEHSPSEDNNDYETALRLTLQAGRPNLINWPWLFAQYTHIRTSFPYLDWRMLLFKTCKWNNDKFIWKADKLL
jgi:hypothetical protein